MKNMKKLLALALALLMLLSLSACGGFEMRMARAASRMSKLESVHTDAVVTADVNLSLMGNSSAVEAKMELSADTQKEPLLAAGQLNAGVYGISKELGFYAERSGDTEISVYLSTDGGQNWETNTLDMENASFELDLSAQLKAMAGMAALFTETGKETVNGVAAVGYAGLRISRRGTDLIGVTTLDNTVIMNSKTGKEFVSGSGKLTLGEGERIHLKYSLDAGSFDFAVNSGSNGLDIFDSTDLGSLSDEGEVFGRSGITGKGSLDFKAGPGEYTLFFNMHDAVGTATASPEKAD